MPFAHLKVPAGLLDADAKRDLVDEVAHGGWGIRGRVLTLADLQGR